MVDLTAGVFIIILIIVFFVGIITTLIIQIFVKLNKSIQKNQKIIDTLEKNNELKK